jgi:hypothetical protein
MAQEIECLLSTPKGLQYSKKKKVNSTCLSSTMQRDAKKSRLLPPKIHCLAWLTKAVPLTYMKHSHIIHLAINLENSVQT